MKVTNEPQSSPLVQFKTVYESDGSKFLIINTPKVVQEGEFAESLYASAKTRILRHKDMVELVSSNIDLESEVKKCTDALKPVVSSKFPELSGASLEKAVFLFVLHGFFYSCGESVYGPDECFPLEGSKPGYVIAALKDGVSSLTLRYDVKAVTLFPSDSIHGAIGPVRKNLFEIENGCDVGVISLTVKAAIDILA